MVLTKGDDFPLHQTPEPVAFAGTDRNFYDRYFFHGYAPNGSDFFAVAFGVYPHLNVADAHFSAVRGGIQHNLHASRELNMERMDLTCGPIRIEVLEPLHQLRILIDGEGIKADLTFTGRAFPIEEPRFTIRIGPRVFTDLTRMTQNGFYSGWIEIDGVRIEMPTGTMGTRDRSWGVRPVGARDQQPHSSGTNFTFFWQWVPINFTDRSVFFHVNAKPDGRPVHTRAVIASDGAMAGDMYETEARMEASLQRGTRWPKSGSLAVQGQDGLEVLTFEVLGRFQMRGLGYSSSKWGHGLYHGSLVVEREDFALSQCDPAQLENHYVQLPCKVTSNRYGEGFGVFEQLIVGPYQPFGLLEFTDLG